VVQSSCHATDVTAVLTSPPCSLQVMELCEGGGGEFDFTTNSAPFQLWEQDALVREHTQYLAATAAAAAPTLPTPATFEAGKPIFGTSAFCLHVLL